MWKQLAEQIKDLDYVVQRNWFNLPDSCSWEGHNDLDLFVSDKDRLQLEEILKSYELVDCRSKSDKYYPPELSDLLLEGRREFNGFYIPSKEAYFLSLYYHNVVHKNTDPYKEELKRAFLDIEEFKPTKCTDDGVGFYI